MQVTFSKVQPIMELIVWNWIVCLRVHLLKRWPGMKCCIRLAARSLIIQMWAHTELDAPMSSKMLKSEIITWEVQELSPLKHRVTSVTAWQTVNSSANFWTTKLTVMETGMLAVLVLNVSKEIHFWTSCGSASCAASTDRLRREDFLTEL